MPFLGTAPSDPSNMTPLARLRSSERRQFQHAIGGKSVGVNGNGFTFRGSGFDQKHNNTSRNNSKMSLPPPKQQQHPQIAGVAAPAVGPHHIKSRYDQARKARVVQKEQPQQQQQQQQHSPSTSPKQGRLLLPSGQVHHPPSEHKIQHLMQQLTTVNVNVNSMMMDQPRPLSPSQLEVVVDNDSDPYEIRKIQKKSGTGGDVNVFLSKTRTDGTTKGSCESTIPSEEEYSHNTNTSDNDDDADQKFTTSTTNILGSMNVYDQNEDQDQDGSATLEGASTFDDTLGASTFDDTLGEEERTFDDGDDDDTLTFDNGFASDADTTITTKLSVGDDTYTANTMDDGDDGDDDDGDDEGSGDDNSTTYLEYMKKRFIRNSRLARHLKQMKLQSKRNDNGDRVISNSPSDLGSAEEKEGPTNNHNVAAEDNATNAKNSVIFGKIKNTVENIQLTMEEGIEQVLETAKTMTSTRSTVNNKEGSGNCDDGDDDDLEDGHSRIACGATGPTTTTTTTTSKSLRCGQVAAAAATVADDTFTVVTNVVRNHTFDTYGRPDGPTNSMVDEQQPPISAEDDHNIVLTVNREGIRDEKNMKNGISSSPVDDGHHELSMALDDLKSGSLSKLNLTTLPMGVDRHDIYVTVDVDDLAASVNGGGPKQKHNRTYSPPIPSSIGNFSYQGPVDLDKTFRESNTTTTESSSSTKSESSGEQKRFQAEIQSALIDDLRTVYTSKTPDEAKLVLCVVVVSVPSVSDAVVSKPIQAQRQRSKNSLPSTKKMTMGVTYRLFDPDTLELYSGGVVTTDYLAAPSQSGAKAGRQPLNGMVDVVLNKLTPRVAMDVVHKISSSTTSYDDEDEDDACGEEASQSLRESPTDEVSGIISTATSINNNNGNSPRMSASAKSKKRSSRRSSDFLMEV